MSSDNSTKFRKENIRLIVLDILREKELHGYGIAEEIENKYGVKRPSPGLIYPLLSSLKKKGYVEIVKEEKRDKKTYRITQTGMSYLEEKKEELENARRILSSFGEFQKLGGRELMEVIRILIDSMNDLDDKEKEKIGKILRNSAKKLKMLVELGEANE